MNFDKATFQEDGYCELGRTLQDHEVDSVRELFARLDTVDVVPEPFQAVFEELEEDSLTDGPRRLRKLRRLIWNAPDLFAPILVDSGAIDLAEDLLGENAGLVFHAAFLKPALIGGHVAAHQDQALWSRVYPNAFSVWTALTEVHPKNGGLGGYPGSHHQEIEHRDDEDHPWHATVEYVKESLGEFHDFILNPGESVMWDRWFVHASGANRSTKDRQGMVAVFTKQTEDFDPIDFMPLEEIRGYAAAGRKA